MKRTLFRIPVSVVPRDDDGQPLYAPMPGTIEHAGHIILDTIDTDLAAPAIGQWEWDGAGPLIEIVPLDGPALLAHLPDTPMFGDDGEQIGTEPAALHMPVEYAGWSPYDSAIPAGSSRAQLLEAVTAHRWHVMTSGLTLPGGVQIGTTVDDQNRITSVVANAALAGLSDADEVDFKAASGWTRISIGQIKIIAGTIGQFVQACYSAERAHHDAIQGLPTGDLADYDITAGWPANGGEHG